MDTDINLQRLLERMEDTQKTNHQDLMTKVEDILVWTRAHEERDKDRFAALDLRLAPVEAVFRTGKWAVRSIILALIAWGWDMATNHVPKWLHVGGFR